MRFLYEFQFLRREVAIWREPFHKWRWYRIKEGDATNYAIGRVRAIVFSRPKVEDPACGNGDRSSFRLR